MNLPVRLVNAFTSRRFEGNPAGVVPDATGLSPRLMQAIAGELKFPETAFVLPPSNRQADVRLRWFTPACEVALCGHATVAAFHVLAEEGLRGMRQKGCYAFRVETRSGILRVVVEKAFSGTIVEFQLPLPVFRRVRKLHPHLLSALGVARTDLHESLPAVRDRDLFVPLRGRKKLWSLSPDQQQLRTACREARLLGVCLFTLQTVEEGSAVHSRFFAPAVGIDEDPVTGSANGPLGVYLQTYAERDVLHRRGRVKMRLSIGRSGVQSLSIAGEAVTLSRSEFIL
jgi:PhzF family phenazine biosynthesis protein